MSDFRLARRPGRPCWYIVWSDGGRSRRRSTGAADREQAELVLAALRLEIAGSGGAAAGPGQVGLTAVLDRYVDGHAVKLPSAAQARAARKHLVAHFGAMATVAAVTEAEVDRYIESRRDRVSDETISRELSVLRAALRRDRAVAAAPRIRDVPRADARERVLTRDEAARLLRACRGKRLRHLALFVRLGLYTGARPGALLDLTWERVDFVNGFIDLRLPSRSATRKRRAIVPLDPVLSSMLERAKRARTADWVINWGAAQDAPAGAIKKAFRSAARKAGLKGVTPGTLRHTAASWARKGGADLYAIGALLGHTKLSTTQRYAKYGKEYLQDVVGAIRAKPAKKRTA